MAHSFLIDPGFWNVTGHWLKSNTAPISLAGTIQTTWKQENWFKITTKLTCDDAEATQIVSQCRGNLSYAEKYYTYVSQHSLLGNIEGEGRLGFQSIVQYYWFIGTTAQEKGIDVFDWVDSNTYHLTSSVLQGHSVKYTIEAVLKR